MFLLPATMQPKGHTLRRVEGAQFVFGSAPQQAVACAIDDEMRVATLVLRAADDFDALSFDGVWCVVFVKIINYILTRRVHSLRINPPAGENLASISRVYKWLIVNVLYVFYPCLHCFLCFLARRLHFFALVKLFF